ncbi:hypothetical protein H0H81_000018 [Sphagnurus paluster]|uniref:Uncharacterized protein n=1 Tax=Sphagnurus paluster TaxID=117069 RepID=A0A9P7G0C5_9AGAR|nr:hypothetical protein H0H81_000018 [Sphagnurus paluster]
MVQSFGARTFQAVALSTANTSCAAPSTVDPCVKISEKLYVPPSDVLACYKAFPFSEALRQNVLTNIARVFDFFTFEEYYLNSPPPFQESTTDIRKTLERINSTKYETDYDFNKDLFDFTTQLNDGHTRPHNTFLFLVMDADPIMLTGWWPDCYTIFQNLLPTPIINIEENGVQGVYIAFDIVELFTQLGPEYSDYFDSIGFDWKRLQGAKVLEIEGQDPYAYVDHVAKTISGNYLDHGIRVNSVFSSYRISSGGVFSQRVGDLAGPWSVDQDSMTFKLITINSTTAETVKVPFLASYLGAPFTDKDS